MNPSAAITSATAAPSGSTSLSPSQFTTSPRKLTPSRTTTTADQVPFQVGQVVHFQPARQGQILVDEELIEPESHDVEHRAQQDDIGDLDQLDARDGRCGVRLDCRDRS